MSRPAWLEAMRARVEEMSAPIVHQGHALAVLSKMARTDLPALLALVEALAGALGDVVAETGQNRPGRGRHIRAIAQSALSRYAEGPK